MKAYREDEDSNRALVYRIGRKIYFFDDIHSISVCAAIKYLDEIEKESKKPIEILLSSDGGEEYSGLALYDRIRSSECEIAITATGMVASMAVIIYLAGDYRYITEASTLLNHQSWDQFQGKVTDLKINMEEVSRLEEQTVEIIAERTGLSSRRIKAQIKGGDDYIKPERAVEDGFSHEIIPNKRTVRRRKKVKK